VPKEFYSTYATSLLDPTCDFYQPSPDLKAPGLLPDRTKTLSLIFVTALRILYTKPSNDPVFPADKAFRYPGDKGYYYYNSQAKARAFACIDETIFCAPSGSPCWHANDPIPADGFNTSSYWLMKYALKSSNTYDAIKLRLGSGLLAQQRVGQSRSTALADNHWQLEAEHLFKTSLARAQFDAWSIASAEDHDNPTYTDTLPDEARGEVCGLFKFQASGYVNIRIQPFVWLMLAWPLMLLLSVELKTYKSTWHMVCSRIASRKAPPIDDTPESAAPVDTNMNSSSNADNTTEIAAPSDSQDPDTSMAISSGTIVAESSSDPDATSGTLPQPPNAPSITTSLIAPSSRVASSHVDQNYGTCSTASSIQRQRDSAKEDAPGWSPLLIHSPIVLGAWIIEKLQSKKYNGTANSSAV
jgi:hypothetical protein